MARKIKRGRQTEKMGGRREGTNESGRMRTEVIISHSLYLSVVCSVKNFHTLFFKNLLVCLQAALHITGTHTHTRTLTHTYTRLLMQLGVKFL